MNCLHFFMPARIISIIFFFNTQNVLPQEDYVPIFFDASPQVSSIHRVGEIPIDIATGKINYKIPIFEIREGDFTMPINLSYNYSGLLIDKVSSYAGMGWAFNIGGSILHIINHLNDETHERDKIKVENYIKEQYPYDDYITSEGLTIISKFIESVAKGETDGSPDKYSVNIGNINCSFFLDKDGQPIFLKNENYKVKGSSIIGFTLTDDRGINYIFDLPQIANKEQNGDSFIRYNSSFLITEINFPFTSNKIMFEYDDSTPYTKTHKNQTFTKTTNRFGIHETTAIKTNTTNSYLNLNKLRRINTKGYSIELQYNENLEESAIAVIKSLNVIDNAGDVIKNFDFGYSSWFGQRINLLSVKLNGQTINTMEYDMEQPYPLNTSENYYFKKDLWGYYNSNASKINTVNSNNPFNNYLVKPNFLDTKIGSLKKISHLTGGYSIIEYEPNIANIGSSDYNLPYKSDAIVTTNFYLNANSSVNDNKINHKVVVIDNAPIEVSITSFLKNYPNINSYEERQAETKIYLKGESATPIFSHFQKWANEINWIPAQTTFSMTKKMTIRENGTYYLWANSTNGSSSNISISYKKLPNSFDQSVGGIRVKKVKNCDFNDECITTNYNYTSNGESTGLMLQKPKFYYGSYIQDDLQCQPSNFKVYDFYNYTSIYPLSNFRGSPVLYKTVKKTIEGGEGNSGFDLFSYYGQNISNSLRNETAYLLTGLLKAKVTKDKTHKTTFVKRKKYLEGVDRHNPKFIFALDCKELRKTKFEGFGSCDTGYPRALTDFYIDRFKYEAKNFKLNLQEDTEYFAGDSLTQKVLFEYDLDSSSLKAKIEANSNGKTITKKFYYPDDVTSTTALPGGAISDAEFQAIKQLQTPTESNPNAQHRIGEVVQEVTEVTDTKNFATVSKRNNYANWGNNQILPKSVQTLKGATTSTGLEERAVFHRYDSSANPLEVSQKDGMHTVYVYGYNKQYPIAKIENATFSEVASALGVSENALENFNETHIGQINGLRAKKPEWMITTYTHIPLVGIKTVTDPKGLTTNYEYDDFNRLKHIKDHNGDILEAYDYHYKTE